MTDAIKWTEADQIQARSDGWSIALLMTVENRVVISQIKRCRVNFQWKFKNDASAERYVRGRAAAGSQLHAKALAYLTFHAMR